MKRKLKSCSIVLSLTLVLCMFPVSVAAASTNALMDDISSAQVEAKTTFAREMDAKLASDLENGLIKDFDEDAVNTLREEYSFASSDSEKAYYSAELGKYGVYIFNAYIADENNGFSDVVLTNDNPESTVSPNSIFDPSSGSNDVSLNTPTVFYDSIVKEWTVTCGGIWKNDNWRTGLGIYSNVGDADAFGVGYTNLQTYYDSYVISAYAYIEDENKENRVTTSNRSDGDGSKGFGFRLQDKARWGYYVGYKWYGSCTYDMHFSAYGCIITGYYIHTYSNATINNIKFGINGKTAGIEVAITNSSDSFTAYSADLKWGIW